MKNGYRYTESGVTNVWLANGYTIRKTKYGEGVSIHDMDSQERRGFGLAPGVAARKVRHDGDVALVLVAAEDLNRILRHLALHTCPSSGSVAAPGRAQ